MLFVHYDDVDHAGHTKGFDPKEPAYLEAIAQADRRIGRLLAAIRARKTYRKENWLIIVSTDHGGSGRHHGGNTPAQRTIFLLVSGTNAVRGPLEPPPRIVDVPATALAHLGIAIKPGWGWDGKPVGLRSRK